MLPGTLQIDIATALSQHHGKTVEILSSSPLGGGSINHAIKIHSTAGDYFLKYNNASLYPGMFEKEALGLQILADSKTSRIPAMIATGESLPHAWLLLEYLSSAAITLHFWEDFGNKLAKLHRYSSSRFGLDHDNYIGSLPQSNRWHEDWTGFFIEERLAVLVRLARDQGHLTSRISRCFDRLYQRLDTIFPLEVPSLLHGDLWSGNFMTGPRGEACLIDPAVYYGHREMDLGMSRLFGGFNEVFYERYQADFPLEKGWTSRIEICNLYPLLVHLNLFGSSYLGAIESVVQKF